MLNVKKTLTKILDALKADCIVEEGTDSNGWYVRKWNSGFMEASILIPTGTWGTAQSVGGVTRQELTNIPTRPPFTTISLNNVNGTGSGAWMVGSISSQGVPQAFLQRVSGSSAPINISIKLEGTWKLGGVIRTLKNAISNLTRKEVVVC